MQILRRPQLAIHMDLRMSNQVNVSAIFTCGCLSSAPLLSQVTWGPAPMAPLSPVLALVATSTTMTHRSSDSRRQMPRRREFRQGQRDDASLGEKAPSWALAEGWCLWLRWGQVAGTEVWVLGNLDGQSLWFYLEGKSLEMKLMAEHTQL